MLLRINSPFRFKGYAFSIARKTAFVQKKLQGPILKTRCDLLKAIHKCDKERIFICELPPFGYENDKVLQIAGNAIKLCF